MNNSIFSDLMIKPATRQEQLEDIVFKIFIEDLFKKNENKFKKNKKIYFRRLNFFNDLKGNK